VLAEWLPALIVLLAVGLAAAVFVMFRLRRRRNRSEGREVVIKIERM